MEVESMSEATEPAPTTASIHGPRWGARAAVRAELYAGISIPAWEVVMEATGIGAGTRVLDVGCGSGEFCQLAAARGAAVSGIDAAEGMIEVASQLLPDADLRVGAMERLPWEEGSFDVVTGFNAFQFAADFVAALAEARRVARPGGLVAICNWGRPHHRQLLAVTGRLQKLRPPAPPGPMPPEPPEIGEPGVLEDLARRAGLRPREAHEVDVPYEAPDQERLERGLLAGGNLVPTIEHSGEDAVRKAIVEAAEPFRRPDGSYRFENRFRYLIAVA
jgi:SAM-dependent methyltransferase